MFNYFYVFKILVGTDENDSDWETGKDDYNSTCLMFILLIHNKNKVKKIDNDIISNWMLICQNNHIVLSFN